ncbi:RecF/RecN/SMC protein [Fistulina hepatica ATCC 64428]|uniref:Structural maintenance of chromosomes protein n=1 Tax=Fistulina hepatica ATCC 64428 TaxID=1128425 RepID=A0A0D6ZZL6_9AGAR|nr:RecF/RecN/SMC protein [Fistulina hepatica ATCC 64428]
MVESDDDDEFVEKPKRKGKRSVKPKPTAKGKGKQPAKRAPVKRVAENHSDSDNQPESSESALKTRSSPVKKPISSPKPKLEPLELEDIPDTPIRPRVSLVSPFKSQLPASQTPGSPLKPQGSVADFTEVVPDPTKPRLVIHKIVLNNFKSYAGRQEIGPFHKSFSAIVGPNGSGKSNTIDALLFVFGYKARGLRQSKVAELIHHSARYPDLDECSVEVHFRDVIDDPSGHPDKYTVVPDSKMVVTRQAFKDNKSRYTIDGRQKTASEVKDLLKGRGIDLDHKRFLILQGEVESIALMKPKAANANEEGLLEYLEDIIGTARYQEAIDQALEKYELLQEEWQERISKLRMAEKEKKALEEDKREAEIYLRLKNELAQINNVIYQFHLYRTRENDARLSRAIAKTENILKEERDAHAEDIAAYEQAKNDLAELEANYQDVKVALEAALKALADLEKDDVALTEKRKHANTIVKKLSKEKAQEETKLSEAKRTLQDANAKIEKEKAKIEELQTKLEEELQSLEKIRDSLKSKTEGFNQQIEALQKDLEPWNARINAKTAELTVAVSEQEALEKKSREGEEALRKAEDMVSELESDLEVKVRERTSQTSQRETNRQELEEARRVLRDCQGRLEARRAELNTARAKHQEALAAQASTQSEGRVIDELNRMQRAGEIVGFHGRLGGLGTIAPEYDVAITTACPQLNYLVVDTVAQAQRCLEHLRARNVGRASFMILEKMSHNPRPCDVPQGSKRLFDLVKLKERKFEGLFYYALRDTLVTEDLRQANAIAFGGRSRRRVVTMAGQLIEASGTMSGGGSRPQKGGMSSKATAGHFSPQEIQKLRQAYETAQQQFDQMQQEVNSAEAEVNNLSKNGPTIEMTIQKLDLDIKSCEARISDARKRLQEVQSKSKLSAKEANRLKELEGRIATFKSEVESLTERAKTITDSIKGLEQKIIEIGGSKLLAQKSKVEGTQMLIGLANEEISKAEVQVSKAEREIPKLERLIADKKEKIEEANAEKEQFDEEIRTLQEYLTTFKERVEESQDAELTAREQVEERKGELRKSEGKILSFRQREAGLESEIKTLKDEKVENETKMTHWLDMHAQLELAEVDDEDDEDDDEEGNADGDGGGSKDGDPGSSDDDDGDADRNPDDDDNNDASHEGNAGDNEFSKGFRKLSDEELRRVRTKELDANALMLDEKIQNLNPNMAALEEYRRYHAKFLKCAEELEETTARMHEQKEEYEALRKRRLDEFMQGFNAISGKLKEMYQTITLGGNAELELVDSMNPFSEGIIFSVMPPKKSWRNIANLSGGEKTLSSLALVFALHVFKPTPLYFMDEIDAALDFRNVSIVANYIKDKTKNAQFIIISLRNDMFELSQRLIGIYKTANTSKSRYCFYLPIYFAD